MTMMMMMMVREPYIQRLLEEFILASNRYKHYRSCEVGWMARAGIITIEPGLVCKEQRTVSSLVLLLCHLYCPLIAIDLHHCTCMDGCSL
jgi:hypothetical protein